VIRNLEICAFAALICLAAGNVGSGQNAENPATDSAAPERESTAAQNAEQTPTTGARRFGPLYEEGRPPPATDDRGWPADWDKWPHLSVDVFGATRELNATRDFRNGGFPFGHRAPLGYGAGAPFGYGNGVHAPMGYGAGPYGGFGYGAGPFGPRGFGRGWDNRDFFSADSGFALRYGYPPQSSNNDERPSIGYAAPAYGPYPPPYGYGAYGGYLPYSGYGPRFWGPEPMMGFPGGYGPYFGW
jgi:hypothetical protein